MRPRSLADQLRAFTDDQLHTLLSGRLDLAYPIASDVTALAARATTAPSVARCLEQRNALELCVLAHACTLSANQPVALTVIAGAAGRGVEDQELHLAIESAIRVLRDLALLWGDDDHLRAIAAAHELAGVPGPMPWPMPRLPSHTLHEQRFVDEQAGLAALRAVTCMRELLDLWSESPPPLLRGGGLGVKDFANVCKALAIVPAEAALWIQLAVAADLVADNGNPAPAWTPTDAVDGWTQLPTVQQWHHLAAAWLELATMPSLADAKSNVLAADAARRAVVDARTATMTLASTSSPGQVLDANSLLAVLNWAHPRKASELRDQTVGATLVEADLLGIVAAGALSQAGRALVVGEDATLAMAQWMPTEVDHVLIQADLTVIVPGPATAELARQLVLVADVESRGHATVYRLSAQSLRRALDAGWDAEGLRELLTSMSSTPLPQSLGYLIDDTARAHGSVRVGSAASYVRCDEMSTLAYLLADRRLTALGLHRVASTVLVSDASPADVITTLRSFDYAPAGEGPDGQIMISAPSRHRTSPQARPLVTKTATAQVRRAVVALREQGPVPDGDHPPIPRSGSAASGALLREAVTHNRSVRIAYADADGTTVELVIDPIRVGGGSVTAFEHHSATVRTFALSRIAGVGELAPHREH